MKTPGAKKWDGKEKTADEFNEIARNIFAPVYPVIARQAIECCGFDRGFCIDAGCGPGHLALALASISGFTIDALDMSQDMLACAKKNIQNAGMSERIHPVHGDVHALSYDDCSVDLVISRGSVFFWEAPDRAFAEIYRVLKPGGRTFIGGGFGTPELKAAITAKMNDPSFGEKVRGNLGHEKQRELRICMKDARIRDYEIRRDASGFWIVMRK
jgi:ubiquinone/menaquinone biosynthesis C-methylase UbiE